MQQLITADRERRRDTQRFRETFSKVRNAERGYAAQLRKIAAHVGQLVEAIDPTNQGQVDEVADVLIRYAEIVRPWAREAGRRMVLEVGRRDELAWLRYAREMGVELRQQLASAPIGALTRQLQEEQVDLITSLPLEAARRVQEIARGHLYSGERASVLRDEILRTGHVTRSRATLIARTETAKASSVLTQARAKHVGSAGYVWRTVRDRDVRPSHKKMEGVFVRWDHPPEVEPGKFYHAGQTFNCRCFSDPIFPNL